MVAQDRQVLRSRQTKREVLGASSLGLGTGALGNLYQLVEDADAYQTVSVAWEAGIRYFDTAPLYGSGLAEKRLGKALAGLARDEYAVSTKVGRVLVPGRDSDSLFVGVDGLTPKFDFSREAVLRTLSESMERLGTSWIDIVYVHDPDDHYYQALSVALPTLAELRDQGTIRALGVGMNQAEMLRRFISEAQLDYVLLANRYTLLDQSAFTDLFPACMERGVSVILGGALNSGILADPASQPTFDYRRAPPAIVAQALRVRDICSSYGVPLLAAALQFCDAHPAVDCVLIGARSSHEVTSATTALEFSIPGEMWTELKAKGFLPANAPIERRDAT